MSAIEFTPEELEAGGHTASRRKFAAPDPAANPGAIVREVASAFGLSESEILGRDRYGSLPFARRALYARLRAIGWSYPQIGRYVGRDHTTVMGSRCPVCRVRGHGKRACPQAIGAR